MAQRQHRKIVAEITRIWDQVRTTGSKVISENTPGYLKQVTAKEGVTQIQLPPRDFSSKGLIDRVRLKVNSTMTAYEDFIGITQVKEAHSRVLKAELTFLESQNKRRDAQRELADVQNQLSVLRVEIDRTARGDDRYLELIKKEISVIREERLLRSRFEEFEKLERDLFSELSNSLRFSHEKERAQNEKTKYWSILGSIIGAFLGIVGTTVNSRIKQQQTRAILSQTSSQVQEIQETVNSLAVKLNNPLVMNTSDSISSSSVPSSSNTPQLASFLSQLNNTYQEREKRLELKTEALIGATKVVESKLNNLIMTLAYHENNGLEGGIRPPTLKPLDEVEKEYNKYRPKDKELLISAIGLIALFALTYKFY